MGNIYVCEDCEQECDTTEIINDYESGSPGDYSGCHGESELIEVSECCEAEYKIVDENEFYPTDIEAHPPLLAPDSIQKCGTMVNEPTLMDNLKSILVANSKALLNEGER